jgi:ornithine cyclodeaminase/alanine dehydrogenase
MVKSELLYLSYEDVVSAGLTMAEILDIVERVFLEKSEGRTEMPPKPGIHTKPNAFIHAMPSYLPRLKAAGIKWVSGYPENHRVGLPYITGLLILNDPETGIPISIMDCTWITAMRTAAATAVAARYLARPDSSVVGIVACGVQGRTNLEALKVVFPGIERVLAYDIDRTVQDRYVAEMAASLALPVKGVSTVKEAVAESDIIVTSTPIVKDAHPVIEGSWFRKGAFASPVDFDCFWKRDALMRVDKFCTDDIPQLMYYKTQGYFQNIPKIHAEVGDLVTGKQKGRETPEERTMAINLGISLEDMGCARRIYDLAREKELGTLLPL